MGWFGRTKDQQPRPDGIPPGMPTGDPAAPRDEALSFWPADTADAFRREVHDTLAEDGVEVVVHPDHVVTADGRELGLWNLAAKVRDAGYPPPERRQQIRDHCRPLLAPTAESDALDGEDYHAALRVRLVDSGSLAQLGGPEEEFAHGVEWAPGVLRLPVLDLPETVATPMLSSLREQGPVGPLLDRAWRNTEAVVATEDMASERVEADGSWVQVIMGSSFFTASMAIFLPRIIERFEPGADLGRGVLLAVPFRHQLAYRIVDGTSQSVLDGLLLLPRMAVNGYHDAAGPLSPHTYLWRDGEVEQLTSIENGSLTVRPGTYLQQWLTEDGSDGPT